MKKKIIHPKKAVHSNILKSSPINASGIPYPLPPPGLIPYLNANDLKISQKSSIDRALIELSNNKLFIGFIMIMLNIGGRYLSMELPKNVERLFESTIMRSFVVFCISFMGTRDIKIAIIITLLFVILMKFLFHEESACCILPDKISKQSIEEKKKQEELMKLKMANLVNQANQENVPKIM
jgi:hypothetical protein